MTDKEKKAINMLFLSLMRQDNKVGIVKTLFAEKYGRSANDEEADYIKRCSKQIDHFFTL